MSFNINKGERHDYLSRQALKKHLRNYYRTKFDKFIPELARECGKYRVVQIHGVHGHFYSQEYVDKMKQVALLASTTYFWVFITDVDWMYNYNGPSNFIPVFYGSLEHSTKFAHFVTLGDHIAVDFLCDEAKPNCMFCLKCITVQKVRRLI
jgi:hypothetical protein